MTKKKGPHPKVEPLFIPRNCFEDQVPMMFTVWNPPAVAAVGYAPKAPPAVVATAEPLLWTATATTGIAVPGVAAKAVPSEAVKPVTVHVKEYVHVRVEVTVLSDALGAPVPIRYQRLLTGSW
jgi:hypothetical protein